MKKQPNTFNTSRCEMNQIRNASGSKTARAVLDDMHVDQYVNENGSWMSTDASIHNVTSITQKTKTFKNADIHGKTFKVRELTLTLANGNPVVINLFMDNSTDES